MNIEIIQQEVEKIQELDVKTVKKLFDRGDFSDITKKYSEECTKIDCERFAHHLEEIDRSIRDTEERRGNYYVDGIVERTITIPLGEVKFKRTRYVKKGSREYVFLLDNYLGIDANERMTDAVKARILKEAVDTTYLKGGEKAAYNITVSKQTTKNIIDNLDEELIKVDTQKEKRQIEYLYIDADEAHVKIQKNKDVKQVMCKEIYVYEGKELEAPKSKRKRLVNKWTFSGIYEENGENIRFWNEVREYIKEHYDITKVKKIFLNGDGGTWIKEGINIFPNVVFVFDKYHLMQYINEMTSHLKDSISEAKAELYNVLAHGEKDKLDVCIGRIYNTTKDEKRLKIISRCETFLRNNMTAIKNRLNYNNEPILGCSAEGHISHDLASRMTTICRGWSISNANKMSKLRAFRNNNGDFYALIKANHKWLRKERKNVIIIKPQKETMKYISTKTKITTDIVGKYYDLMQATIDQEIRTKYNLNY